VTAGAAVTKGREMSSKDDSGITRRNVVRSGLAGAALTGTTMIAGSTEVRAAVPKKWDHDADVVCIGYGGAGATTAIAAHDAGAKVLILEKMPQGGGNTSVSAGGFVCPTDAEEAYTYMSGLYKYSYTDWEEDLVRMFAQESVKNAAWIEGLKEGTKVAVYGTAGYPKMPGAKSIRKFAVLGAGRGMSGSSDNLWAVLSYAVEEKRKIPVLTETAAKRLVTNDKGEVIGVIAESKGRDIAIRARRGVVLTCGGYEFDDKTLKSSLKGYPVYGLGTPGNTGDGVRMAQELGAAVWHMNGVGATFGIKVPEFPSALYVYIAQPGHIYVDRHGKRFVNEKAIEAHAALLAVDFFNTEELQYPRIPCYAIFDEETRLKGPISVSSGRGYAGKRYKWSSDNSAEIDKGWIIKGATLAELARKIKMRPADLEATLNRWNVDVKTGADTQFHRPLNAPANDDTPNQEHVRPVWSAPIETPPFYAMELYPAMFNTQGGPRRNVRAQIIDHHAKPIPRLYSAGELGSMWGMVFQGASNIAECIVFGQIAGRNAAAEKSWV
jgi:succinate dehydrogenase/fumarate reductase flavoprotein subunit